MLGNVTFVLTFFNGGGWLQERMAEKRVCRVKGLEGQNRLETSRYVNPNLTNPFTIFSV